MKNLVKVLTVATAMLFVFGGMVYGIQSSSVYPTTISKGAYANGADGNHLMVQTVYLKLTGGWAIGGTITIDFPADVTLPDIDQDAVPDRTDEPIVVWAATQALLTFSVTAASATSITLTSAGAVTTAADEIWIMIPIETAASPALGSDDYTVSFGGVAVAEGADIDLTVTYADQLDLITWEAYLEDAAASGRVQTNVRGKYLPDPDDPADAANTMVGATSLPNLITTGAIADISWTQANVLLWAPTIGGVAMDAVDDNDVAFYLWASQIDTLERINTGNGQRLIDYDDTGTLDPKTYPLSYDNLDFLQVGPAVPVDHTGFISIHPQMEEGDWYIYVTSDATGDWVLGRSDTLEVRKQPVFVDFYDPTLGTGVMFDDDFDGDLDGGDGTVAAFTLESGGVIGIAGTYSPATNEESVDAYWFVEDVDDNAEVHIFRSTSATLVAADIDISGSQGSETVDGLNDGEGVKIHTSSLYEEDDDAFVTYDIQTSDVVFEPADIYYLYVILNDGKNQAIRAVDVIATGVAVPVTVKHFPYFGWHPYNPVAGAVAPFTLDLESATSRYATLSWGNPPAGSTNRDGDTDLDADGTATITIYAVNDVATPDGGLFADIVTAFSATDDAGLLAQVVAGNAWVLATITDSSDTQAENRYEWDVRNSGLVPDTYYLWAVMEHDGDKILAQFNPNGTPDPVTSGDENDIQVILTHGSYMRPITPYAGPPVELDDGDKYRLSWEAFDKNTTGTTPMVHAALVKVGANNPGSASMVTWANTAPFDASDDIVWVLPVVTVGADPAAGEVGATAADASVVIDISTYTATAGAGAVTEGDYELYYFYDADEDDDQDWVTGTVPTGVKAPGTLYLSKQTTSAYNVSLSPNKASMSPGDILTVDIYATDDGTANDPNMAMFFVKIPNASYFTIIDQDGDAANGITEPFDNLRGAASGNALNGDVLMNSVETTDDGAYLLGYLEKLATGSAALADIDMVSFQFQMTSSISDPLEDLEIIFTENDDFPTNLYDEDGSAQSTSIPPVALTIRLGQSGTLTGVVDVEGRDNEGEEVNFYLTEAGALTPITDAAYLAANSDADGTDGIQITLDGGGYYELSGIPSGEYDVLVRKSGYLDAIRANQRIVSLDNVVLNFTGGNKLYGGDAAGFDDDGDALTTSLPDNRVDAEDTDAIADAFGASSGDATWNAYADIDASGEVGINDLFMASKNLGTDGDGVFYKVVPGSNEDAMIWLAKAGESAEGVTYAVRADDLGSLSAYSVDMSFSDWELVGYADGLLSHSKTIRASRLEEGAALFGSAIAGYNPLRAVESMELMAITLRAKVMDPETPAISKASLVDGSGNLSEALLGGFDAGVPEAFSLSQNYPNPFNPTTNIDFSLPVDGQVKLAVYNLLGEEIHTLVADNLKAGTYKALWNSQDNMGRKVPSGIYFYRLVVNSSVIATHKMVLLK